MSPSCGHRPRALEDLKTQLAAGQDYHPAWDGADGIIVVRIADEQGPLPAGAFASRIAAARRDQQLLPSDSEQRILEDALLIRLAQQIHDRTVDARDLIRAMNREMHSRKMSSGKTVGTCRCSPPRTPCSTRRARTHRGCLRLTRPSRAWTTRAEAS